MIRHMSKHTNWLGACHALLYRQRFSSSGPDLAGGKAKRLRSSVDLTTRFRVQFIAAVASADPYSWIWAALRFVYNGGPGACVERDVHFELRIDFERFDGSVDATDEG